jgi:hypothetical protein
LESLKFNDIKIPITVFEDLSPYPYMTARYQRVCDKHGVPLSTSAEWVSIQGNANRAMKAIDADVVILMSDDVMGTPHAIDNMVYFWENNPGIKLGGVLFSRLEAAHLVRDGYLRSERDFYALDLNDVPPSNDCVEPKVIHSLHGSACAISKKLYNEVGGFAPSHWAFDEDISWQMWLNTDYICCIIPGYPMVHLGGASQPTNEHEDLRRADQRELAGKDWGIPYPEINRKTIMAVEQKQVEYNAILKGAKTYRTI